MKANKLLLITIFNIILSNSITAQSGYTQLKDENLFVKAFNDKSKSIQTNQADFIQEKNISALAGKIISKGKFYYKATKKMRWETTSPNSNIIVLNNGKMLIKEKDKIKVHDANSNKMLRGLNDVMLLSASGEILNSPDYTYKVYENSKFYLVIFVPLSAQTKKFISSIEIYVTKADYLVKQIIMREQGEDYTKMEFSDIKLNLPLEDNVFTIE